MKLKTTILAIATPFLMNAQTTMTPEILWTLKKIGVQAVSPDHSSIIYKVGQVDLKTEKTKNEHYFFNANSSESSKMDLGKKSLIQWDKNGLYAKKVSKFLFLKMQEKLGRYFTK